MANGGLGQFAGSFAEALTRTKGLKDDKKRKDELAALQAKLVEAQLKAGEVKLNAQTTLADLMTGTVEEFEEATPTITPGGREIPQFTNASQEPLSLLDILSGKSSEGQLAAIQSGIVSGGDLLDFQTAQDELAARPDINKLFSGQADASGNPMFIPVGITIDSQGRPAQQFGLNPEFNTAQQDAFSRQSLSQLTNESIEIMDIESELSGSLLESGFPFGAEARTGQSTLATLGGAFGIDTKSQKQAVAKRDRVEKLYGQILGIRMQRLSASGESITNDKLAFLQSVSPDTNKSPDANARLLADFLQEEINRADIEGTKIPANERKKVLDFIRKARSGEFLESSEPIVDAPGFLESAGESLGRFKDFTLEQLQNFDMPSASPEQIKAVRAQFDQRKKQGVSLVGSAFGKVESGFATAKDFAKLTIDQISQIDKQTFNAWTKQQQDAFLERINVLSPEQKVLAKFAFFIGVQKVKAGIATAKDFAELTIDEIKQIDQDDIKNWTKEQVSAFNKRRKELGL